MLMRRMLVMLVLLVPLAGNTQTCQPENILPTTAHLVDNKNGTVSDPKTGLIWKRCSEGQIWNSVTNGCDGSANPFHTWKYAFKVVQNVNGGISGQTLGHNDWRLPNINELTSIVEEQCVKPAFNLSVFPSTPALLLFWSSTPTWNVSSDYGHDGLDNKDNGGAIRLVRSGQ